MKIYLFVLIVLVFHLKGGECYNHKRNLQKSRNLQTIAQNCSIPNTSVTSNMMPIGICPQQIFIIQLGIGNPAQNLFYIVDTGEQFIEVLTNQPNQTGFLTQNSSTLQLLGQYAQIDIGNGLYVTGQVGSDFITLNNYVFQCDILIVSEPVPNQYNQVISGVAGLGLGDQTQNFLEAAYQSGMIASPDYTVSINQEGQSYLYYNQIPTQIIDQSIYMKSRSDSYYSLHVIGLSVGGVDYSSKAPTEAIISSATTYFYLNQKIYNEVIDKYFSNCQQTSLGPSCDCNTVSTWPIFSIMFSGAEIYIEGLSYVYYLQNGGCSYGFGWIENDSDQMVLGTSFFLNYNITFQPNENTIGIQGNISPVQVLNSTMFSGFLYACFVIGIGMAIASGVLVWYLRVIKQQKPIRTIEFSISDRFIQTD